MKQGKRPTRKEKQIMLKYHLNPNNWLVSKRQGDMLTLVHRYTNSVKQIPND
ncbi:DUF6906 family protein [Anoxybacteroides rupiense]|uniref:DUF6906 family protein n=1 Tax=Anoxybacteroides rupiense TaxID=311460 RepID=UPI001F096F8E|nr:hypothetical protein [Anoxybacillus rupiensis]